MSLFFETMRTWTRRAVYVERPTGFDGTSMKWDDDTAIGWQDNTNPTSVVWR